MAVMAVLSPSSSPQSPTEWVSRMVASFITAHHNFQKSSVAVRAMPAVHVTLLQSSRNGSVDDIRSNLLDRKDKLTFPVNGHVIFEIRTPLDSFYSFPVDPT
jgi:hypothetical protein